MNDCGKGLLCFAEDVFPAVSGLARSFLSALIIPTTPGFVIFHAHNLVLRS